MKIKKELIAEIKGIIAQSRNTAVRSVDTARVLMYWQIGKVIFEEEQDGEDRAAYGSFLIQSLAGQLQPQFGSSFSRRQLYWYVQFYRTFPIVSALRTQFNWTHYKVTSKYQLYLPTEKQLIEEVKKEIEKLDKTKCEK